MKKILLILLFPIFAYSETNYTFSFYGSGGTTIFNGLSKLNDALNTQEIPKIKNPITSISVGGGLWINRFCISMSSTEYYYYDDDNKGNFDVHLSGYNAISCLHYNVLNSEKLILAPYVGLGVQNFTLECLNKNKRVLSDVLNDAVSGTTLKSFNINIEEQIAVFGLNCDYKICNLFNNTSNFSIGVDLSYTLANSNVTKVEKEVVDTKLDLGGFSAKAKFALSFNIAKIFKK